jgi:hypothetical protein
MSAIRAIASGEPTEVPPNLRTHIDNSVCSGIYEIDTIFSRLYQAGLFAVPGNPWIGVNF